MCKLGTNSQSSSETRQLPPSAGAGYFCAACRGKVFSTLYLAQAYNQVVVQKDSRDVLTVKTSKGANALFSPDFWNQLCRQPLPEKEIEQILRDIPGVVAYLDILLSSRSTEKCFQTLNVVLSRLEEAGLKVRATK